MTVIVRAKFPKVYKLVDKRNGLSYWVVDARSKKWGMNERPTFTNEKGFIRRVCFQDPISCFINCLEAEVLKVQI